MKTKPIKIYKNGMGIHEVIKELQRQEIEMIYLEEKLRSGETGKRNRLLDE
tara:strand:- start:851 stop:1003 length:153 start_codon:yes stop_codon:yes gene_type:complete